MRAYETRMHRHQAHEFADAVVVPHRSRRGPTCKGWKIGPSHYLNQDLANIWLDK